MCPAFWSSVLMATPISRASALVGAETDSRNAGSSRLALWRSTQSPSDPPDCRLAAAGDEYRRTVFLFHLKCRSRRTTAEQRSDLTLAIAVLADGFEKPGNCRVTQSGA